MLESQSVSFDVLVCIFSTTQQILSQFQFGRNQSSGTLVLCCWFSASSMRPAGPGLTGTFYDPDFKFLGASVRTEFHEALGMKLASGIIRILSSKCVKVQGNLGPVVMATFLWLTAPGRQFLCLANSRRQLTLYYGSQN